MAGNTLIKFQSPLEKFNHEGISQPNAPEEVIKAKTTPANVKSMPIPPKAPVKLVFSLLRRIPIKSKVVTIMIEIIEICGRKRFITSTIAEVLTTIKTSCPRPEIYSYIGSNQPKD